MTKTPTPRRCKCPGDDPDRCACPEDPEPTYEDHPMTDTARQPLMADSTVTAFRDLVARVSAVHGPPNSSVEAPDRFMGSDYLTAVWFLPTEAINNHGIRVTDDGRSVTVEAWSHRQASHVGKVAVLYRLRSLTVADLAVSARMVGLLPADYEVAP